MAESSWHFQLRMLRYVINTASLVCVVCLAARVAVISLALICAYEIMRMYTNANSAYGRVCLITYALYILLFCFYTIYCNPHWIVFCIIGIYTLCSDGCSYIFGYRFGKSEVTLLPQSLIQLCHIYKIMWLPSLLKSISTFIQIHPVPSISPNKTIAGYIGTIIGGAVAYISILSFQYILSCFGYAVAFVNIAYLSIPISILGQIFDLFESYVKRQAGVKDSGTILGSRGGICDRLDSMGIVSVCVLYLHSIGWIVIS
jgi:CDP-diglyceride synthetase